ncbi:MAG: glycoside hydrolase family 31 protein [Ktedonobacterales bacterium]
MAQPPFTPADDQPAQPASYRALGDVQPEVVAEGTRTSWRFSAADGTRAEVAVLAADLVRVRLLPPGHEPARSWYVARTDWPAIPVRATQRPDGLTLDTGAVRVRLATQPMRVGFAWDDGQPFAEDDPTLGMGTLGSGVRCHKRLPAGEQVLGAGERTEPLDRRGRTLTFWNLDPPYTHGDATRAMYVSIPFWLGLRDGRAYGILLDSAWRSELDAGATHPERLTFGAAGGALTYYVFAGPTPAAVLARYADLTGHMPLPPRWALGYQQSRWSYFPEDHLRAVAHEFRARHIPCDALYLDIDYMDGYRDFTWSPRRYPDPDRLLAALGEQGFKVVPIIDPGIKLDPTDPTFASGHSRGAFCRLPDGTLFTGHVWPGECVFPDFSQATVRAWWGERHQELLHAGVAGIWNDMNEPSLTTFFTPGEPVAHGTTLDPTVVHAAGGEDGPPLAHAAFHNAYGLEMARATYEGLARLRPERRPFVLTRSGGPGIQRYAAVWTGDNSSIWPHLRLAVRMCLGLGLSGVPFVGADVGGFWQDCTGELLVRFTQLGAVLPFFRNHSARRTHPQEPWAFGQPYEALCRQAIELRYRLLPYVYTAFAQAAAEGTPIARALAYAYPQESAAVAVDDQLLLGDALLAAPVLDEDVPERAVYFPAGTWVDLWSGQRSTGPQRIAVAAPLDALPLFAREGSIVPLGPLMQYVGERPSDPITLACYLGAAGSTAAGTLYEDDGASTAYRAGAARHTRFSAVREHDRVEVHVRAPEGTFDAGAHAWVVELHLPQTAAGQGLQVARVQLDGSALPAVAAPAATALDADAAADEAPGWSTLQRRYETVVRVAVGRAAAPFSVVVTLGTSAPDS